MLPSLNSERALAAAKRELAEVHQELGAKRRELEGLYAEIKRKLEVM